MTKVEKTQKERQNKTIDKIWNKAYGPNSKNAKKQAKAKAERERIADRIKARNGEQEKKDAVKKDPSAGAPKVGPAKDQVVKAQADTAQKAVVNKPKAAKQASEGSRAAMMKQAQASGIKYFRVMNKEELAEVLKSGTSKARIEDIATGAVKRWKEGWKLNNQK